MGMIGGVVVTMIMGMIVVMVMVVVLIVGHDWAKTKTARLWSGRAHHD